MMKQVFPMLAGVAMAMACASVAAAPATDPAGLVDPFVGTGNGGAVTGHVNTFPGATLPFGMLSWSPTTSSRTAGGDYYYKDAKILGFSLTHISGPGCSAAGEIPVLPTVGDIGAQPAKAAAAFDHTHEKASPGTYAVTLDPASSAAVQVKLAATTRSGIGVFRFPAHAGQANFLFKVSDAQTTSPTSSVRVVGNDEVVGSETSGRFCGTASTATLYFVARFNRPFASFGTWGQGSPVKGRRALAGARTGAWVSFDASAQPVVKLKIAISYVSVDDAMANLKAEDGGWSFKAVADVAHARWNRLLSRAEVTGGTRDAQVQFYTALYHSLLHPNVFSDVNGKYIGFDDRVRQLPAGQKNQYANFSGWDIYRSEIPLLAMLVPQRTGDMMSSLLNDAKQGGWLPKWGYDNDYTGVMNGDAADPVIAEAYAFGVRNFDAKAALAAMVKGATRTPGTSGWSGTYVERPNLPAYEHKGYVPGNPSETLEYATADYAIARLAQALGDTATYRKFLARSDNWKNVFDRHARFRGFAGYVESRAADGSFPAGPAFQVNHGAYGQSGFEEGNAIQYTWMVPQDLPGLIAAMGGDKTATARLDKYFQQLNVGPDKPYYWAGNEMCLDEPWIYNYTGQPWKTQAVVHRIIDTLYADAPGGEPGNDDLGAMSSWLVFADLGLYPETPGAPLLVVGAPVFPHATLHLGDGHTVTITAPHASMHGFVQSLQLDGRRWDKSWLPVSRLLGQASSTRLDFVIGSQPNKAWGAAPADRPGAASP
ncbi:MAG TPA: GH92 family glycosyl hydrolase [Rhodanobacteraceae bacterium]